MRPDRIRPPRPQPAHVAVPFCQTDAVEIFPNRNRKFPGRAQQVADNRPEVHVLLDASQNMRLGSPESPRQEATALLRAAIERQEGHADVRVHRFGERLVTMDLETFRTGSELAGPDNADTQLATAATTVWPAWARGTA